MSSMATNGFTIFGLGKKALIALEFLKNDQIKYIDHFVIGKDNNVLNDYSKELENFCKNKNINYSFRNEHYLTNSKFIVAIGWRWLINNIHADQQLFVFHDSLLPKYRGFNPLVTALIKGDTEIGVSCIEGIEDFDKGDIIAQYKKEIKYPIKIEKAIDIVSEGYGHLLLELIQKASSGERIVGSKQDENEATYSVWRDEENYYIDWNQPAEKIKRFIDAVGFPYAGARTNMDGKEIIVQDAELMKSLRVENNEIGKVLMKDGQYPIVICGSGLLKIKEISDLNGNERSFPKKLRYRFKNS